MIAAPARILRQGLGCWLCLCVVSCGGGDSLGGSSSSGSGTVTPASNVASVEVSAGPNGSSINTLYTSVTVCLPGTTTCQTIDNIQVDTGSYGLRIVYMVFSLCLDFV